MDGSLKTIAITGNILSSRYSDLTWHGLGNDDCSGFGEGSISGAGNRDTTGTGKGNHGNGSGDYDLNDRGSVVIRNLFIGSGGWGTGSDGDDGDGSPEFYYGVTGGPWNWR